MEKYEADYTNTFRALAENSRPVNLFFSSSEFKEWEQKWHERLENQGTSLEDVSDLMLRSNPAIIPRNHRVEEALEAAVENADYTVMQQLLEALEDPYKLAAEHKHYAEPPDKGCGPYRTYCGT